MQTCRTDKLKSMDLSKSCSSICIVCLLLFHGLSMFKKHTHARTQTHTHTHSLSLSIDRPFFPVGTVFFPPGRLCRVCAAVQTGERCGVPTLDWFLPDAARIRTAFTRTHTRARNDTRSPACLRGWPRQEQLSGAWRAPLFEVVNDADLSITEGVTPSRRLSTTLTSCLYFLFR